MAEKKLMFVGSIGWLIFWAYVFWPIAIGYYYDRRKMVELKILD